MFTSTHAPPFPESVWCLCGRHACLPMLFPECILLKFIAVILPPTPTITMTVVVSYTRQGHHTPRSPSACRLSRSRLLLTYLLPVKLNSACIPALSDFRPSPPLPSFQSITSPRISRSGFRGSPTAQRPAHPRTCRRNLSVLQSLPGRLIRKRPKSRAWPNSRFFSRRSKCEIILSTVCLSVAVSERSTEARHPLSVPTIAPSLCVSLTHTLSPTFQLSCNGREVWSSVQAATQIIVLISSALGRHLRLVL
jgi:hypothetical protein